MVASVPKFRDDVTLLVGGSEQTCCSCASTSALLRRYFDLSEAGSPSCAKLAMSDPVPLDICSTTTDGGATICRAMSSITFLTASCGLEN
eukprot:4845018-Pyramimonas_sp.AAC.1